MDALIVGGSAPYREAVAQRLHERGHAVLESDASPAEPYVAAVYCDSESRWAEMAAHSARPDAVAVAVLPSLALDDYIRALAAGAAGVVYVDTPSGLLVDAIEAAVDGEVRLPRQAAQGMASFARREHPSTELDDLESMLLQGVASGRSIVGLADELHFSERTIRRHLQSVYLKLGVSNRAEAIARAARLGLTD